MILNSDVNTLDLYPEIEVTRPEELLKKNVFSAGGRLSQFYEDKTDNKLNLELTFMTTSDASLVNKWWTEQDCISVVDPLVGVTSGTYFIANQEQPFRQLHRPYSNMWRGSIQLEHRS